MSRNCSQYKTSKRVNAEPIVRRSWVKFIHLACASLILSTIFAGSKVFASIDYYKAEVPVSAQTTKERKRAAKIGLAQVVLRVSGSQESLLSEIVQDRLATALNYVEQFQYRELKDEQLLDQGFKELIVLSFSPIVVEKLLSQAELPFWPLNRPKTLIWLVEDHPEFGRQFVMDDGNPVLSRIQFASKARGVPLMYPVLDLDDQLALTVDDVWDMNEEAILTASERYKPGVVLVGKYSVTSGGDLWSTWQFFHSGDSRIYDSRISLREEDQEQAKDLGEVALYPLADFLAQKYAFVSRADESPKLVLELEGINDFAVYRKALNYFENLAVVSGVDLSAANRDTLILELQTDSQLDHFLKAVQLDGKIHPLNEADLDQPEWARLPLGTVDNPLRFAWGKR